MKKILLSVFLGVLALAILAVSKAEAKFPGEKSEPKFTNGMAKNIIFDSPDLEVNYTPVKNGTTYVLKGYPSRNNGRATTSAKMGWYSPGVPCFIREKGKIYEKETYGKKGRISLNIQMLNDAMREKLAKKATAIYGKKGKGTISKGLIHLIPLAYFKGVITIQDKKGNNRIFQGEVENMEQTPFQLVFEVESEDIDFLVKTIESGIPVKCKYGFAGFTEKKNELKITLKSVVDLNLIDQIFGKGQRAYLSRKQLGNLAARVHRYLKIEERYQIDGIRFRKDFIKTILLLSSQGAFTKVDFLTAFKELSHLLIPNLAENLKANTVKTELSKVFQIEKSGEKQTLKVNKNWLNQGVRSSSQNHQGQGSLKVFGIFGAHASLHFVDKNYQSWKKGETSLSDQMEALNRFKQNDIQWEIQGNIVVPKSVNVALFDKTRFTEETTLSRVLTVEKNATFQQTLVLRTGKDIGLASLVNGESALFKEIKELKGRVSGLETRVSSLEGSVGALAVAVAKAQKRADAAYARANWVEKNSANRYKWAVSYANQQASSNYKRTTNLYNKNGNRITAVDKLARSLYASLRGEMYREGQYVIKVKLNGAYGHHCTQQLGFGAFYFTGYNRQQNICSVFFRKTIQRTQRRNGVSGCPLSYRPRSVATYTWYIQRLK